MKKQILYLGDIHGAFKKIKKKIQRLQLGNNEDITYIVQVGDFGIGFHPKSDLQQLQNLNNFFASRNIIMIAIRGNHDDPSFFQGNHIYSNLQLVPDYTVMELHDIKHLFVGGAVSIDRTWRLTNDQSAASYGSSQRSYWFDELFILDEEKLKDITGVEVVVTHTAPEWCYPDNRGGYGKFVEEWIPYDSNLTADLDAERIAMSKMFDILKQNGNWISSHFYGHFHSSSICMNGYTNHYLLNIDEFFEL
jgi:predicted phosphodiesterase